MHGDRPTRPDRTASGDGHIFPCSGLARTPVTRTDTLSAPVAQQPRMCRDTQGKAVLFPNSPRETKSQRHDDASSGETADVLDAATGEWVVTLRGTSSASGKPLERTAAG